MKLSIPKKALERALSRVEKCVDRKASQPVLSSVLLVAENGALTLSGTDLFLGAIATVPAAVSEPGRLCVPAKTIVEIVKSAADGDIALSSETSHHLTIKAGKSKFRIHGQAADDYPALPQPNGDAYTALSARHLAEVLGVVSPGMSTDDTRPHLACAKLEWEDSVLRAVSTDGHRLTKAEHKRPGAPAAGLRVLIPHKAVHEVHRFAAEFAKNEAKNERDAEIGIQVAMGTAPHLFVRSADATLSIKLADEQFPPYAKVIPQQHKARVLVLRESLLDATRRITVIAGDRAGTLALRFEPGVLRVLGTNVDIGEGTEEIAVDYAAEAMTLGMNAKYLTEALLSMAGDEVAIEVNGELDPVVVKPTKSELDVIAVLMPMRL